MTDLRAAIIRTRRLPPLLRFVLLAIVQVATNDGFGPARVAALQTETGIPPEPLSKALDALRESGDIDLDDKNNVSLSGKYRDFSKTEREVIPTGLLTRGTRARGPSTKSTVRPLTEQDILDLAEKWKHAYTLDEVRELCAEALGHKASKNWIDMRAGCNKWIRTNNEWRQERRNGPANRRTTGQTRGSDFEDFLRGDDAAAG